MSVATEEAATELLDYAGYQVINLKPFVSFVSLDKLASLLTQVKPTEIILFYRQLALLLEAGMDIVSSLEVLRGQVSNHTLKSALEEVITDIRGGNQLSVALSKHPKIFSPMCWRSLHVGEQSGGLEITLRQIADYLEREAIAAKDIKSALMMPIITAIVTVVVIVVLMTFVLPAFGGIYSALGAELPPITRILIDGSTKLQNYGLYILLVLFIVVVLAYVYIKTPQGRYRWDKLTLSLPLVGRVQHLKELARCCRSISLLFRAGLALTEIMPLVTDNVSNKVIIAALNDVQQDMLKGEGLSQPLAKNKIFLPMMVQMVKVGEETGNLDIPLLAVSQSYETEVKDRTDALIALIQPAMTLLIALIVGFIAVAMVSAMYSIYGQV